MRIEKVVITRSVSVSSDRRGVEVGANTEVGALSVVPKHRKLEADAIYGGVPVRRLDDVPGGR